MVLRETIASSLKTARSLHCEAEKVMIVEGFSARA
jgi:DNA-binding transcriptional MocR family regulator